MPELPEVEIVKRGLEPHLVGQRIATVDCRKLDLRFPYPERFCARLEGRRVRALDRRAKYIRAHLDSGEVLIIHLGMTGRLSVSTAGAGREAKVLGEYMYDQAGSAQHDHVVMRTANGTTITYNDPRRFGFMLLVPEAELDAHPHFDGLGVEPLGNSFDADYIARLAAGRETDLKAFLLNQRIVAGLGNIYVSEALYRAGLSPKRRARTLVKRNGQPNERVAPLVGAIRGVLSAAIDAGGSTLRDYRHADGSAGAFQEAFAVYDREGEDCRTPGCAGRIKRIVQSGRSTFYCPSCQR